MSDKEIDEQLYKGLDADGILRMKAVEYTIEFLKGRDVSKFSAFNEAFERVYNSLKNGVTAEQDNDGNKR